MGLKNEGIIEIYVYNDLPTVRWIESVFDEPMLYFKLVHASLFGCF